jgi:hypothetical protein
MASSSVRLLRNRKWARTSGAGHVRLTAKGETLRLAAG